MRIVPPASIGSLQIDFLISRAKILIKNLGKEGRLSKVACADFFADEYSFELLASGCCLVCTAFTHAFTRS